MYMETNTNNWHIEKAVVDYILSGDKVEWRICTIIDMNELNTDHQLLMCKIKIEQKEQEKFRRSIRKRESTGMNLFEDQKGIDKMLLKV